MKIGWIGVGGIGAAMVRRLLGAGFEVTVYRRGAGLKAVTEAGAETCDDYRALAAMSDVLCMCVYDDAQLRSVLLDEGALGAMRAGSILVVHTTGSPALARQLGQSAPSGVEVLDCAFSGSEATVLAGDLTLMVGGADAALERARPMLGAYCRQIHYAGPHGSGQMTKLLNNLLLAANMMNASEALRVAENYGVEPSVVARVVQASSGASYAMNLLASVPDRSVVEKAARPYLEKDVATAMKAASDSGLDVSAFLDTAAFYRPR